MNRQDTGAPVPPASQRGFTLVEISVVLIVIGLIVSAVSLGRDLQRNAGYQAVQSTFIQSWTTAYQNYHDRVGVVVGDDAGNPTGEVNEGGAAYCNQDLVRDLQQAGVQTPGGRGPDSETRFAYQDANGNPQEVEVCFESRQWSIPDGSGGFVLRQRNVMVIDGLAPDLARYLDARLDNRVDARFGQLREDSLSNDTAGTQQDWSLNAQAVYGGGTADGDEHQLATLTAHYLMSP